MSWYKWCDRAQGNESKTAEEHSKTIHTYRESGEYVTVKMDGPLIKKKCTGYL